MNICIITLYKSYNCGSYYQAYALGEYLKQENLNVYYLKMRYTFMSELISFFKPFKKIIFEGFKSYNKYNNEVKKFKKEQKKLNLISKKNVNNECDICVLGSDTIWNFDSDNLYKMKHIFLGDFFSKYKFSYAVSMANSKISDYAHDNIIIDGINNIDKISARDEYTKNQLCEITNKNIPIVCDPTMLVDSEMYIKNIENRIVDGDYIFIYMFDDLCPKKISEIKEFAEKNNLKIVSGTKKYLWVDMCIENEPKSFINGIYYSKYVMTDTFHGTIFSTIFRKNFVVINRNKNKVNDFINRINLADNLVQNDESICKKITKKTNYDEKKIMNYIEESKEYIKKSIEEYNKS